MRRVERKRLNYSFSGIELDFLPKLKRFTSKNFENEDKTVRMRSFRANSFSQRDLFQFVESRRFFSLKLCSIDETRRKMAPGEEFLFLLIILVKKIEKKKCFVPFRRRRKFSPSKKPIERENEWKSTMNDVRSKNFSSGRTDFPIWRWSFKVKWKEKKTSFRIFFCLFLTFRKRNFCRQNSSRTQFDAVQEFLRTGERRFHRNRRRDDRRNHRSSQIYLSAVSLFDRRSKRHFPSRSRWKIRFELERTTNFFLFQRDDSNSDRFSRRAELFSFFT